MKRALIGIPAVSVAVLLFLLVWHAFLSPSPQNRNRGPAPAVRPAPRIPPRPAPPRARASPDPAAPAPPPSRGILRRFAHAEGRGQDGVRFVLTGEKGGPPLSLSSAPDGTCTVPGLAAGEWTVAARHPKFVPAEARARVEAGATEELAVELNPGGRAFGLVADASGRPLPQATVTVLHGESRKTMIPPLSARTDAAGRYLVEGIPLLELGLHFRSDRHKPLIKEGILFRYPGDAHEVNAALEEGATVSGRVVNETGLPIPGAAVTAGNEHASAVLTDAEGRFTVHGLGEGDVNLSAGASGYGTGYLRGAKPGMDGLEIRLLKAGTVGGFASADAPLPAFAVILSRFDPDFGRELRVQAKAFEGSSRGEFAIPDVAPGTYWVEVEAEGFETVDRPQVVVLPGQAAADVRVRLRKKE